ncbi:MAG: PIN domain-containing protein [Synergistaceae bacterium]|nr:PIN domain-containing protein [Synergistaceae bacterium]
MLIDTNILLDVLQMRTPHFEDSFMIWGVCEYDPDVTGYISTMSPLNIAYIMRKELTSERIQEMFMTLASTFEFVDLKQSDLAMAADMKWRDFEDAVQAATASRIHADYIITRNTKDFEGSNVRALTPEEYFAEVFTVGE